MTFVGDLGTEETCKRLMRHVRLRCVETGVRDMGMQLTCIGGLEMAPLIGRMNLIGTICLPMSFNSTRAW